MIHDPMSLHGELQLPTREGISSMSVSLVYHIQVWGINEDLEKHDEFPDQE